MIEIELERGDTLFFVGSEAFFQFLIYITVKCETFKMYIILTSTAREFILCFWDCMKAILGELLYK